MSETKKSELVAALIAAKRKFKPVTKNKQNPHFRSTYADLSEAHEATQAPLWDNGLEVLQTPDIRDGAVVLVTTLEHVSGEKRTSVYPLTPAKPNDPQALGACMTYARRFCYMAILGIAPEDDDGNEASGRDNNSGPKGQTRQPAKTAPSASPSAPPAANGTNGSGEASPVQVKQLNAAITGRLGIDDRDDKLAWLSGMLGRPIASSKEVKAHEVAGLVKAAENGEMPEAGALG